MSKHKSIVFGISILVFLSCGIFSCFKQVAQHPSKIDFEKLPFKTLSEYGFFRGEMSNLEPNEDVLPYEPIATLFTDYAHKLRFVWMPKGTPAKFDVEKSDLPLDFPEKTILVKNFYYPEDFSKPKAKRRIIETRLLVKYNGQWAAYPYRWNDEQTEAKYKVTGEVIPVSWVDEKGKKHDIKYTMPNKNQCKSCHSQNGKFMPIGPKLKQLNHAIAFEGSQENQLDKWQKMGYLATGLDKTKIVAMASMHDTKASFNLRARSYLDVNCGHCHSSTGTAASSGLRLNIEEKDPYHWGVGKSPVAAGIGAGNFLYDIYPDHANESIITFRMNSTNPGIMMPEIGRVTVHQEGVELIKTWINSLEIYKKQLFEIK